MIISVEVVGTLAITQQMSNLNQLGKIPASQYNEQSRKVSVDLVREYPCCNSRNLPSDSMLTAC